MIIRLFAIVALALITNVIVFGFNNKDTLSSLYEVDASDWIGQTEAYIVAEAYFLYQISGDPKESISLEELKNSIVVGDQYQNLEVNK